MYKKYLLKVYRIAKKCPQNRAANVVVFAALSRGGRDKNLKARDRNGQKRR
jgi:hypothetical protein